MGRLDKDRQAELEPKRVSFAKNAIIDLGYLITYEDATRIEFYFKGSRVMVWPYSGWFSGATVKDGRGIKKLLEQIDVCRCEMPAKMHGKDLCWRCKRTLTV